MVLNVHRKPYGLLETGRRGGGGGVWRWGEREIIYLSPHCHHQHDSCIKMGSDESYFKRFINCEGQSHKTVSRDHNFWTERRAEADSNRGPSAYQPNALQLGQTGSQGEARLKWRPLTDQESVERPARGKHRVALSCGVQPASPAHGWPQLVKSRDCKASCGLDFRLEGRLIQRLLGVLTLSQSLRSRWGKIQKVIKSKVKIKSDSSSSTTRVAFWFEDPEVTLSVTWQEA